MKFIKTPLEGLFEVELEKIEDQRGFFSRKFCRSEFGDLNLCTEFVQSNISFNKEKGVLRGMHYQSSPYQEVKYVSCISGSIFDVAIDMREDSSSYLSWYGCELNADNFKSLYIPEGFAHGYQTLESNSCIFYMVSNFYSKESERGVRYDDPSVNIDWPLQISTMSDKDKDIELI